MRATMTLTRLVSSRPGERGGRIKSWRYRIKSSAKRHQKIWIRLNYRRLQSVLKKDGLVGVG